MALGQCLIALLATITAFAEFDKHWLEHIAPAGKRIEIEDRSVWYIAPQSRHVASGWETGDELKIYPNLDTFSNASFPYYIQNKKKSTPPAASVLQLGPEKASINAAWIQAIDFEEKVITVQTGRGDVTRWDVEAKDLEFLNKWKTMQGIVIGNNEGLFAWWYSSCKYILINVNRAEWIRVTPKES